MGTKNNNNKMVEAVKKSKKAKAPAAHPKYSVMIPAAIAGLKDRSGSSRQAILKWIKANYKVEHPQAGQHLNMALKAGVKKGTLKTARASGKGAGSFKLGEKPKVAKKAKKSEAAKKKATKKPAKKVKKPAAKKVKKPAKKASPKKKPAAKKAAKKPTKKAAPKKK